MSLYFGILRGQDTYFQLNNRIGRRGFASKSARIARAAGAARRTHQSVLLTDVEAARSLRRIWLGRMVPAAMVAATRRTSAQFLSSRSVLPAPAREPLDCQP